MILPDLQVKIKDLNSVKATVTVQSDRAYMAAIKGKTEPYQNIPELFRPALEKIADYVRVVMIPRTFEREGPGWHPLAKRTVRDRQKLGFGGKHPILRRTDDLFKELTEKSHPGHVEIIKVGKMSRIEIGGSSAKFIENQMGSPKFHLPKRSMIPGTGDIPIEYDDVREMELILKETVKSSINKGN